MARISSVSLTVTQASVMLSCSGQTVRKMIRQGQLPAYRVGRDFRIMSDDLAALRVPAGAGGQNER